MKPPDQLLREGVLDQFEHFVFIVVQPTFDQTRNRRKFDDAELLSE